MSNKKYVIEEKVYENHIDDEVHLYGLLHQLAFLAGKVKDRKDMEHFIDTAQRYGEIADEKFDAWNIPGRYMVYGDKEDLAGLKATELLDLDDFLAGTDMDKPKNCGDMDPVDLDSGLAAFLDTLSEMAEKSRWIADTLDDLLDVTVDE